MTQHQWRPRELWRTLAELRIRRLLRANSARPGARQFGNTTAPRHDPAVAIELRQKLTGVEKRVLRRLEG
ncbi:MAG: hypothetical protein ACKVX7_07045 [Planctomycetota bacterium]